MQNIIPLNFEKHHGAGNDFILVEESPAIQAELSEALLRKMCDRRMGIGADGLIRVKRLNESLFEMIYHNSDGPVGSFCGNGARCAIAFAYARDWCGKKGKMAFKGEDRSYEILSPSQIMVEFPMKEAVKEWEGAVFIDTGSPHVVIEVESGQLKGLDIKNVALKVRHHEDYLSIGGTNVNYFEIKGDTVSMRTFERGVENETLACGTGTIAVGMTVLSKYPKVFQQEVQIKALGGELKVIVRDHLWLQGPIQKVFEGEFNLKA